MDSSTLQNLAYLDATFRYKTGKDHYGYVVNLTEEVDTEKSLV